MWLSFIFYTDLRGWVISLKAIKMLKLFITQPKDSMNKGNGTDTHYI